MMTKNKKLEGFTLVELLLVIGIIATLAVVVFVALDPAKRFQDARDAKRTSDVETILSAVHQYIIDNKGAIPADVTSTEKQIGTSSDSCAISTEIGGCSVAGECVDLSGTLAKYLKDIPLDPTTGIGADHTHYSIMVNENGIVTVRACDAEGGEISVSR